MTPTPEQVAAGHAFYTKRALAFYDLAILGSMSASGPVTSWIALDSLRSRPASR